MRPHRRQPTRLRRLQVDSLPAEPQGKPKSIGVGSLSPLQRIFLTQESNQGLLQCRRIPYQLSYQGSPAHPRSLQSTELSSLCHAAASHQLSASCKAVYTCQCYLLNSSHPLLPALGPCVFFLPLCLYSCPGNPFVCTIFLDSIYTH